MSSNYPPGAANDPRAPYNEPCPHEEDVTVKQLLVKENSVETYEQHTCVEREWDAAEGRYVTTVFTEYDDDLAERFHEQQRTALEVITCCERLVNQLMKDGHRWYAHIDLARLKEDCANWQEEEFNIEKL
jgi:hypothetical protein